MRGTCVLSLCVFFAGATTASAQTTRSESTIQFGVKGGLNLSTFGGADSDDFGSDLKMKLGLMAGGWADFPLTSSLSVQPEALLVTKGAKQSDEIFGADLKVSYNLTYLEVPVLLKWTRDRAADSSPFLYAGPSLGLKLRAVVKASTDDEGETDDLDDMKTTDFGVVLGGGVQFGRYSVDGRLSRALTTLHSEGRENSRFDIRNTSVAILVGVALGSR